MSQVQSCSLNTLQENVEIENLNLLQNVCFIQSFDNKSPAYSIRVLIILLNKKKQHTTRKQYNI